MPARESKFDKHLWVWYAAIVGAVLLVALEEVKLRMLKQQATLLPLIVLSPRDRSKMAGVHIVVYGTHTLVLLDNSSFIVVAPPSMEADPMGGRHFASLAGEMACLSDNLVRGRIQIYRDANENDEYRVRIDVSGRDDSELVYTRNR